MLRWLWLSVIVVALDQMTKVLVTGALHLHETIPVMPGLELTLRHNTGAAFSFLSDEGGWQRWFFAVIAIVVSAVLIGWLKRLTTDQRWLAVALALVIGGAIGNVWDRLMFGYVVDFIVVYLGSYPWPAFNIADSAISIGAVILLIDAFRQPKPERA